MEAPVATDLDALQTLLGYQFRSTAPLLEALTHTSWCNEHGVVREGDYERLEFLGDAVLGLVISHRLVAGYPGRREGELSKARAAIVSEVGLAEVARQIGVGAWLRLGRGEARSGGHTKPSILANAMEALIAAVFLDGGIIPVYALVDRHFAMSLARAFDDDPARNDHKTRLQEYAQRVFRVQPRYVTLARSGPDHARLFVVAVMLQERELSRAEGASKKGAEQAAAALALRALQDAAASPDDLGG